MGKVLLAPFVFASDVQLHALLVFNEALGPDTTDLNALVLNAVIMTSTGRPVPVAENPNGQDRVLSYVARSEDRAMINVVFGDQTSDTVSDTMHPCGGRVALEFGHVSQMGNGPFNEARSCLQAWNYSIWNAKNHGRERGSYSPVR